jgi:RHS repeat-associated protein
MRAWSVFRQLLAATLCALLVAPAYPSASTLPRSSSTPSHIHDAETLPETRVWGSNEQILLHFRVTLLLSEKQHWGSAKCSYRIVVGSVVTYDYDAFGNLLHSTATGIPPGGTTVTATPNEFLFAGEQFDSDLNLYYNRARYLNTSAGRFWTMDTFEPDPASPFSLHRYRYASDDPVGRIDPTGHEDLITVVASLSIGSTIAGYAVTGTPKGALLGLAAGAGLGVACLNLELCTEAAITGALNTVFQYAANLFDDYYCKVLNLPPPSSVEQREALVAAFASGVASRVAGGVLTEYFHFNPDNTRGLAAIRAGINVGLNDALQGKTLSQSLVEGLEAALIGYFVDIGVQNEFGPQFHTTDAVEELVHQVVEGISATIFTAISPVQKELFQTLAPEAYRFIYGN